MPQGLILSPLLFAFYPVTIKIKICSKDDISYETYLRSNTYYKILRSSLSLFTNYYFHLIGIDPFSTRTNFVYFRTQISQFEKITQEKGVLELKHFHTITKRGKF